MFTFLRRIRQKLIDSGSITKYLLYAIGEILLVVIGILIALQVNNWNENNQVRKTEIKLLSELKEDLIKTKEDLSTDIEKSTGILAFTDSVYLAIIDSRNNNTNVQLEISSSQLSETPVLFPKLSAYKSIQSYGVNIISNDSLRKNLTELYELQMERVRYTELLLIEMHESELWQYFKRGSKPGHHCEECVSLEDQFKTADVERQNVFVLSNPDDEFLHMFKRRYAITNALKRRYIGLAAQIDKIVDIIDDEVGKGHN